MLWRVRYKLSLRDLAEMFLERGVIFTHEAVREWEAKLAPVLSDILRKYLTLRTRLKRLVRKTLSFSRSCVMRDLIIGLYMNRVEFGRTG